VEVFYRPAVRIVCLDASNRVLLLQWQDPHDGSLLWEPPGGGIEPGETPLAAACRELTEETGLDPLAIVDSPVTVGRDTVWNGRRFVGPEPFFMARYPRDEPSLVRDGLLEDEQANLRGHAWVPLASLGTVEGRLEPPSLAEVIAALTSREA
jgi:8-oxo-dGTP pyrophosphatase MutT (NUDIX family)